jgi:hypothetical protein
MSRPGFKGYIGAIREILTFPDVDIEDMSLMAAFQPAFPRDREPRLA